MSTAGPDPSQGEEREELISLEDHEDGDANHGWLSRRTNLLIYGSRGARRVLRRRMQV